MTSAHAASNELFRPKKDQSTGIEILTCREYLSSDGNTSPVRLLFSIWLNGYSSALSGKSEQFDAEFVAKANKLIEDACAKNSRQFVYDIVTENTRSRVAGKQGEEQPGTGGRPPALKNALNASPPGSRANRPTGDQRETTSAETGKSRRSAGKCDELAASKFDDSRLAAGVGPAQLEKHGAEARRYCREAKKRWPNDPVIAFQLGRALQTTGDTAGAVREYKLASDTGHLIAKHNLAMIYLAEGAAFGTRTEGVALIKEAVALGSPLAKLQYGQLYMEGKHLLKSPAKAARWYEEAAGEGVEEAAHNLALLYMNGEGVTKDLSRAVKLFERASDAGVAEASFYLGQLYETGEGVSRNKNTAARYYEKAGNAGIVDAQVKMGLSHWENSHYSESLSWFQPAADFGDPVAEFYLGLAYFDGLGVSKDLKKAFPWVQRAADKNVPNALALLAVYQMDGIEMRPDRRAAVNSIVHALSGGSEIAYYFMVTQRAQAWGSNFRKALQRELKQRGYYSGRIDGKFGRGTSAAINNFMNLDNRMSP